MLHVKIKIDIYIVFDLVANYISKLRKTNPFTCSFYEISNLFLAVKITQKWLKYYLNLKTVLAM